MQVPLDKKTYDIEKFFLTKSFIWTYNTTRGTARTCQVDRVTHINDTTVTFKRYFYNVFHKKWSTMQTGNGVVLLLVIISYLTGSGQSIFIKENDFKVFLNTTQPIWTFNTTNRYNKNYCIADVIKNCWEKLSCILTPSMSTTRENRGFLFIWKVPLNIAIK
uniref:Lipocalin n=1 Tax=Rhipicephalus microplus TaxID=6941 RepID=A0A6G5AFH6_RHIMP